VGVVGRGGAEGNGGVSHEWLLLTGIEPAYPHANEGGRPCEVGVPEKGRRVLRLPRTARHRRSHARSPHRTDVKKPRWARLLRLLSGRQSRARSVCERGGCYTDAS
jgi:hypothetical protein